jgi:hypothetical protein
MASIGELPYGRGGPAAGRYDRRPPSSQVFLPSDSAPSNNGARPRFDQTTRQRVIVVSYILAVALPPLGFAIALGLLLSPRLRSRHAVWIILLSIVAAAIWLLMINAGALNDTGQGY